jgi:hypothetical protein
MPQAHITLQTHAFDFWLARGAIALIAALQWLFIDGDLTPGPRWLAPGVELALLVPLSAATSWNQRRARLASTEDHWLRVGNFRRIVRGLALLLTALVMAINFDALVAVTRALLHGAKGPTGQALLLDALNIWFTNVVIFALWFWNLDRAGPARRGLAKTDAPDFLFPQLMGQGDSDPAWTPGFLDYFYVAFTNATAFSPTDTMPLSGAAKLLMTIEASVSLLTVGLVAARAVNILG